MSALRNSQYRRIDAKRIAGALGAEIEGVDLAADFDDETMAEIRTALLENQVIFFRDQQLSPARQLAFAKRWGDIHIHPLSPGLADYPEILEVKKTPAEEKNVGNFWHTDQIFAVRPAMATILYAKEVPSFGGDTLFTNQYLAYETLSDGMKRMLDGLKSVSSSAHLDRAGDKSQWKLHAAGTGMTMRDPGDAQLTGTHPLVRSHPETGRRALYIGSHVHNFERMSEEESRPLIDFLMRHSTKPEFTCRFRWQSGSLAIWDNRCTQHYAINDYPSATRIMHRITIRGDVPFFA